MYKLQDKLIQLAYTAMGNMLGKIFVLCCVLLVFTISDGSDYNGQTCGDRDQPIGEPSSASNCGRLLPYTFTIVN